MLAQLKIKNFAIIDDLNISFQEGMTVLTGETGSGKSIIIDAISLLLGERASLEMIRFDKEQAIVEGLFFYNNPKIDQILLSFGLETEDNTLIIMREITKNGRNICRLNGNLVTVSQLKQIGNYLVDIHVQHDTQRLINTSNYLYLIDALNDEDFAHDLKKYQNLYNQYMQTIKDYQKLEQENESNQEKLDFYNFQLNELNQAKISFDEYQDLLEKRNKFVNYDKIYENLKTAFQLVSENKVLERLYDSANHLSKISSFSTKYNEISENIISHYYQLEELISSINNEIESLDYDPQELDKIESRLNVYSNLKRKYKMEVEDLITYHNQLVGKMEKIENYDFIIKQLNNKLKELYQDTLKYGKKLREKRMKIAKEIEVKLLEHLDSLKLANTTFKIQFNELNVDESDYLNNKVFFENGLDTLDFYVSFNIGEPIKPLSKVASGGELSRFMLALKTILMEKQNLATIIFDEIDTGVSGSTAHAIAQKIKKISENTQVLCITHLPQVASISDNHLYISKTIENNRTITSVKLLNQNERITEIAKMIAGENINEVVINNAKNLMKIQ